MHLHQRTGHDVCVGNARTRLIGRELAVPSKSAFCGRKRFEKTIVVGDEPQQYAITVTLAPAEVEVEPNAVLEPQPKDTKSSPWTRQRSLALVAGGIGLAGVTAGTFLGLAVGSQMRREDQGTWHVAQAGGGSGDHTSGRNGNSDSRDSSGRNNRSSRGGDSSSRSRRDGESSRGRSESPAETSTHSSSNTSASSADQAEILKRLKERREKESP